MSGDVQPKKRKDKKRRKDEGETTINPTTMAGPLPNEDVNIHVHSEVGTGGGKCAKLLFFVLFFILSALIGLIIIESKEPTQVGVRETRVKFSQFFENWIDNSHANADDEHSNEHDYKQDEEEHDLNDDNEEDHNDDEETNEDEDENDEDKSVDRFEDTEEESEEEKNDEDDEEEELEKERTEEDDEDDEEELDNENELDNGDNDENDDDDTEEMESYKKNVKYSDEEQEEDEDEDQEEEDEVRSKERYDNVELSNEDENEEDKIINSEEQEEEQEIHKEDNNEEADHENEDNKVNVNEEEQEQKVEDDVTADGSYTSTAVKLGVGVALLIVAQHVLVKKWRSSELPSDSTSASQEQSSDFIRRNTIVVPPDFKEIQLHIRKDDKDYSEGHNPEKEMKHETKYTELRSTYIRSFSPESEERQSPETDEYAYEDEEIDEEEIEEEEYEDDDEKCDDYDEEEVADEDDEDEEDEEKSDDDYDDEKGEELLKRLEFKYGKLSAKKDHGEYEVSAQDELKQKLEEAEKMVDFHPANAVKLFTQILDKYPLTMEGLYGKARALDRLADQRRSNDILYTALELYIQLLHKNELPDSLFNEIQQQCIKRLRFVGDFRKLYNVHQHILNRFPNEARFHNDLVITFLTFNRLESARFLLESILKKWPNDGVALVHYGFILKTKDNNLKGAVEYLTKGVETNAEGVHDGRFYYHLGDALTRIGEKDKAFKIYEKGAKLGLFISKYQRSLYNIPRLTGKPFWELKELPHSDLFRNLKQHWKTIRLEGMALLNERGYFLDESENLKDTGKWKQFELFARGQRVIENCKKAPFTCSLIEKTPEAGRCKRGQTKFSVIHPGTHIWPHCGPTNCRLRIHLGLQVPSDTYLTVGLETRSWKNGEILVFDDSFEHEVWHNGTDIRLILIVDVWHHELTTNEKKNLSPI